MPWALAQGERSLGLDSHVLYRNSNWINYPCDMNLNLDKVSSKFEISKRLLSTFFSIRNKFDVFHFNYGSSLFNHQKIPIAQADLPFYPSRAKLFVTYNGCDARQKFATMAQKKISACHDPKCYSGICNSGKMDIIKRKQIAKMAKYVHHIWAVNPDLLYFLPKDKSSFLPYLVNMDNMKIAKPDFRKNKLKVIHASTDRFAKGSEIILTAMEYIQKAKGCDVEVKFIEKIPHEQAINIYKQADLIIDQILIGWYGGFAVEAMSMGKPVICRIAEEDLHFIPKKMAIDVKDAFINANPANIKEVILRCIEDRLFLKDKSEAAIEYARTWHNPNYVAGITKQVYENF